MRSSAQRGWIPTPRPRGCGRPHPFWPWASAPTGVRVNCVCPGFVATESQMGWLSSPCCVPDGSGTWILPVPGPEAIAPFIVYLASDESAYVTGGIYPIDSGYMAFKAKFDVMGLMQPAP